MSGVPVMGDSISPIRVDPFIRLVEVGWSTGRVAIMSITFDESNTFFIRSLDPVEFEVDALLGEAGLILKKDYYKDKQIIALPVRGDKGEIHAQDEISPTYVGDASTTSMGYVTKPTSGGEYIGLIAFNKEVEEITKVQGRGPELTSIGSLISPIYTTHTHPDGTKVTYVSGWEYKTFTPPDFDWTDSATAVWYHTGSIPARESHIIQKSWLVNFTDRLVDGVKTPYVTAAGVQAFAGALNFDSTLILQIFTSGTEFILLADGGVLSNRPPIKLETVTLPSYSEGLVKRFIKTGFTQTVSGPFVPP